MVRCWKPVNVAVPPPFRMKKCTLRGDAARVSPRLPERSCVEYDPVDATMNR